MAKRDQVYHRRDLEKGFAFSQAVRTGNLLFLSGCVSWDAEGNPLAVGDMAAQLRNVYEEIRETLEENGASFQQVVKETVYTTDMQALIRAAPIRAAALDGFEPPASTWVEINRLVHPDLLVEVEIIAAL